MPPDGYPAFLQYLQSVRVRDFRRLGAGEKEAMIVDSSELQGVEDLEADNCILGAGPAGLTLARELEGVGRCVILIESGGLEFDEATQSLSRGPGDDTPDPYSLRCRQFGGTSNWWWGELGDGRLVARYAIMDETDFEPKEKVPHTGWPFRKSHLEPYYERAQSFLGLDFLRPLALGRSR